MIKATTLNRKVRMKNAVYGDPAGARTLDPLIKSQLLYHLSYRAIFYGCKGTFIRLVKSNKIA